MEVVEEALMEGVSAAQGSTLISTNAMYDFKIAFIKSEAERKYMQERILLEVEHIKTEKEKSILVIEKEKALMELKVVKEQALASKIAAEELKDRDIEIVKLKMQLEFEKEKARMLAEFSQ